MINLQDTLAQLGAEYGKLVNYYEEIASHSQEEADLIRKNQMAALLDLLQVKEKIMLKAEKCQDRIGNHQAALAKFYKLESFSIPDLLEILPQNEGQQLINLQKLINKLIIQLSDLEKQENDLERLLREYAVTSPAKQAKKQVHAAAKKAYSRVPKPE